MIIYGAAVSRRGNDLHRRGCIYSHYNHDRVDCQVKSEGIKKKEREPIFTEKAVKRCPVSPKTGCFPMFSGFLAPSLSVYFAAVLSLYRMTMQLFCCIPAEPSHFFHFHPRKKLWTNRKDRGKIKRIHQCRRPYTKKEHKSHAEHERAEQA